MPICPKCKTNQSKRKNGRCPKCMAKVELYEGMWFQSDVGSPPLEVMRLFEKHVSAKLSKGREFNNQVKFKVNKKGGYYRRELVMAKRLIDATSGDLDLIDEVFDLMFQYKLYKTMIWMERDFHLQMSVALANREARKLKLHVENKTVQDLTVREGLFDA